MLGPQAPWLSRAVGRRRRSHHVTQKTMNTETQQTTTSETTTTWRTLTPALWRIYLLVYLLVWLPSLMFTGYAIREERSNLIGWALLGLGISVIFYVVCMVFAGRIQGSLHREGLSKSGVAPIVIAALVLNPIFGGFYVPLSVLLFGPQSTPPQRKYMTCPPQQTLPCES